NQLNAMMMRRIATDPDLKDNPFAALGVVIGSKLIDTMIDSFVTPSGLANLAAGVNPAKPASQEPETQEPASQGQPSNVAAPTAASQGQSNNVAAKTTPEPFSHVRYSYDSLSKFSVTVVSDSKEFRFVLTRDGLSW